MKTLNDTERQPRVFVRLLGLALIILSVVVATYLVVALLAVQSGQTLRDEQETKIRTEQIARQLELARENFAEGSDNLALTRIEYILGLDPNNVEALALREKLVNATPEPTAAPTVEPTPETLSITSPDDVEARSRFQTISGLISTKRWEEALPALLTFQQNFPNFERPQSDRMLYDTYIALGMKYVNTDKLELALNYFTQAERLGDLPQEALDYRLWADLYFWASSYSGVNWEYATNNWRELCAAAPFFKDACNQLVIALEKQGDQFAFQMEWCPAADSYQAAWGRRPNQTLESKLNHARNNCASATPIPITGTIPFTGTSPITDTTPPLEPGG